MPIPLMHIDAKIVKKTFAEKIQEHNKIIHAT